MNITELYIKEKLHSVLGKLSPGIKRVHSNKIELYYKEWDDIPNVDVIGFAFILKKEDIEYWREVESEYLNILSSNLAKFKNNIVEPSLAFLYAPTIGSEIMKDAIIIERDDLNCRKYVIPFKNNLSKELARLPIASLYSNEFKKNMPQSARKLLFSMGLKREIVDAVLKRGNDDNIINNLPEQVSIDNRILSSSNDTDYLPILKRNRLTEISIDGFRAYNKPYTFDLNADLIVLAGANGLGKTSFFDAIDFVATGSVKRFEYNEKALQNLNHTGESKIEIKVRKNINSNNLNDKTSESCTIIRTLSNPKNAEIVKPSIQNKSVDRKNVLQTITDTNINENLDKLITLFRASHLETQSQADIGDGIRDNSCLPAELLGRMLSLEDYVEALRKLNQLLDVCNKTISKDRNSIKSFKSDIEKKDSEIRNYNKYKNVDDTSILNIDDIKNDYFVTISKLLELGIHIQSDNKLDVFTQIKQARSNMDAIKVRIQTDIENYRKIYVLVKSRNEKLIKVNELRKSVVSKEQVYNKNERMLKELIKVRSNTLLKLNTLEKLLADKRKELEDNKWVEINIKSKYELLSVLNIMNQEYKSVDTALIGIQGKIDREKKGYNLVQIELQNNLNEQMKLNERLVQLRRLNESCHLYNEALIKYHTLEDAIKVNTELITNLSHNIDNHESMYSLKLEKFMLVESHILEETKSFGDMKTLIHKMKLLVNSEECPLCGIQYKEKDELIERIDIRIGKQTDRLKQLNETYASQKSELELCKSMLSKLKFELEQAKTAIQNDIKQQKNCEIEIQNFEKSFSEAGFVDFSSIKDDISKELESIGDSIVELEGKILSHKAEQVRISDVTNNLMIQKSDLNLKSININENRDKTEKQYQALINSIIDRNFTTEITEECIRRDIAIIQLEISNLEKETSTYEILNKKQEEEYKTFEAAFNKIKIEKDLLNNQLSELQESINTHINNIEDLGEIRSICLDEVYNKGVELKNKQILLEKIREDILHYELILDSREKTAIVTKLLDEKNYLEKKIKELNDRIKNYEAKQRVITKVRDNISDMQNSAINSYFEVIAPIASLIQKRLRPAYGFGDMRIDTNNENNVSISVKWKNSNEFYLPSDYFSESQISILSLSIFYSVAFTQNWSSLRTVLLDDPIVHFDDLNVYAFADLLRSWLSTSSLEDRPQLIISTCDDRLLKILRRKFKTLEEQGRAIFYNFKSIDLEGPIIERLGVNKMRTKGLN